MLHSDNVKCSIDGKAIPLLPVASSAALQKSVIPSLAILLLRERSRDDKNLEFANVNPMARIPSLPLPRERIFEK